MGSRNGSTCRIPAHHRPMGAIAAALWGFRSLDRLERTDSVSWQGTAGHDASQAPCLRARAHCLPPLRATAISGQLAANCFISFAMGSSLAAKSRR